MDLPEPETPGLCLFQQNETGWIAVFFVGAVSRLEAAGETL